ncbi:MAG: GNAT family N-acetyltransferase [Sphingomonadaceae bacterium]|nr:GNAT family N-acetyltransferase [Sphingomonadaceae bacterium]
MASKAHSNRTETAQSAAVGLVPARSAGKVVCVPWQDMASEIAAWDKLAGQAAEPNPFFESWYLLPSLEAFNPQGEIAILRFEQDGQLLGLMPLERRSRYYGKPLPNIGNWLHANSFLGTPLVASGAEVHFWHGLFDWADSHGQRALFLHLSELGLDGPLYAALEAVLSAQGRTGAIVKNEQRAILASPLDADSYRQATFSKQKRKDLRRRTNRLSDLGEIQFEWQHGLDGMSKWTDQFLALEASGWKGDAGSALAQDKAKSFLFRESLKGAAQRERLIRLALMLDDKPIAMLSTFLTPPGAFGYKTAFDENYARHAPGILLENEFLSALDHGRFEWCDSCAASDHPVMNDIWRERRSIGKVSIAIGGSIRRTVFNQLLRFEKGKKATGEQT